MNIFSTQCKHFLHEFEVLMAAYFQNPYILLVSAWVLEVLTQDKEHLDECLSRTSKLKDKLDIINS